MVVAQGRSLVCECRSILFAGAAEDLAVVGRARQLAEASASVTLTGHDETARAARQALALAALQQPARHEVLLECVLLVNGVQAVYDNVLADFVTWMDHAAVAFMRSGARSSLFTRAFCLDSPQGQEDDHGERDEGAGCERARHADEVDLHVEGFTRDIQATNHNPWLKSSRNGAV